MAKTVVPWHLPSMAPIARSSRASLFVLLLIDLACAFAVRRLPSRVVLASTHHEVAAATPGLTLVMPDDTSQVWWVITAQTHDGDTDVVRLGVERPSPTPALRRIGADFALLEPPLGLDSFMPTGARFAWNGHALALATPARGMGRDRVFVLTLNRDGMPSPMHTITGTRPSVGWAGDHFEVSYVTPALPPAVGRVQWAVDVDEEGTFLNSRIVSQPGTPLTPLAWVNGVRTPVQGAEPGDVMLSDGTVAHAPHERGSRARACAVLDAGGGVAVHFIRSRVIAGSETVGDSTIRTTDGDVVMEARVGTMVTRPRYVLMYRGARIAFESDRELMPGSMVALERHGVLHVLDPSGFHARFRASDLASLDPHASRIGFLARSLGGTIFFILCMALALAHACGLVVERAARGGERARRFAATSGLAAILLAGAVFAIVWNAA